MTRRQAGRMVLGAVLLVPIYGWARAAAPGGGKAAGGVKKAAYPAASDQYIETQKGRLDQILQQRVAGIERRFSEEQAFRVQMKNKRLDFERKLVQDRKAFLDSLKPMALDQREKALTAFYNRQKEKRTEFYAQRRLESRAYWDARAQARQQFGRPGAVQN